MVTGPSGMRVSTRQFEYTTNPDGKSYPITSQGPYGADSISANLTAPNTIQSTLTKNGKAVATATTVVFGGGKVLTITTKGMNAQESISPT